MTAGASLQPQPGNPVYRAADKEIGDNGQNDGHDKRLERIEPSKDKDLVDGVDDDGKDKDATDRLPPIPQQRPSLSAMREYSPEIGGPALPGILQP